MPDVKPCHTSPPQGKPRKEPQSADNNFKMTIFHLDGVIAQDLSKQSSHLLLSPFALQDRVPRPPDFMRAAAEISARKQQQSAENDFELRSNFELRGFLSVLPHVVIWHQMFCCSFVHVWCVKRWQPNNTTNNDNDNNNDTTTATTTTKNDNDGDNDNATTTATTTNNNSNNDYNDSKQ